MDENADITFLELLSSETKPIVMIAIVVISYNQFGILDSDLGFFNVVGYFGARRQVSLIGILGHSDSNAIPILRLEELFHSRSYPNECLTPLST